jgi:hypothetical protein
MQWREHSTDSFVSITSVPLYQKRLSRLELKINNKVIQISLSGNFSVKKRKVVLHGIVRNTYKISINEVDDSITFLEVSGDPFFIEINALIKSPRIFSSATSKKLLVNKKQLRVDIVLDNNGKIVN